jgi:hypothetical protein
MGISRVIHILSTVSLLLLVLSSPIWVVQVIFVVAYRAFLPALIIGTYPITMFFLQRTSEKCSETNNCAGFYRLFSLFSIHTVLLYFAYEDIKNLH